MIIHKILLRIFRCLIFFILFYNHCISQQLNTEKGIVMPAKGIRKNILLAFIGGTGSVPQDNILFAEFAAEKGFDVAIVNYPNSVSSMDLYQQSDTFAYEKFHEEILYGNDVSTLVNVDKTQSILSALVFLISKLNSNFGIQKNLYIKNNLPDFSAIMVAGHSQGAGHAAYLGQQVNCKKILLFSGPNDDLKKLKIQPLWLKKPTITEKNKFTTVLHHKDEVVDFSIQMSNVQSLLGCENNCSEYNEIAKNCNCIFLKFELQDSTEKYHNVSIRNNKMMIKLWDYLLSFQ